MYRFMSNKSTFLFFASSSRRQTLTKSGSCNNPESLLLTTTRRYSSIEPRAAATTNITEIKVLDNSNMRLPFGDEGLEIALNTKTAANGENENISFVTGYTGRGTRVLR